MHYECVSRAVNFHWYDPLASIDECYEAFHIFSWRTLVRGWWKLFIHSCHVAQQSSFVALEHMCVVEIEHVQHRPIKATFKWHTITQEGFIHIPPAKLKTERIPKPKRDETQCLHTTSAKDTWESNFSNFTGAYEERWNEINTYCLNGLLNMGAMWDKGAQTRGKDPVFHPKNVALGSWEVDPLFPFTSQKWTNAFSKTLELQIRLGRIETSPQDWHQTRRTIRKAHVALCEIACPFETNEIQLLVWWRCAISVFGFSIPSTRWRAMQKHLVLTDGGTRSKKLPLATLPTFTIISKIKRRTTHPTCCKMNKETSSPNRMKPFHTWMKTGTQLLPPTLEQPIKVLKIVWPAIDLYDAIHRRNPLAAPGLDGWRTTDLQALPVVAFEPVADFQMGWNSVMRISLAFSLRPNKWYWIRTAQRSQCRSASLRCCRFFSPDVYWNEILSAERMATMCNARTTPWWRSKPPDELNLQHLEAPDWCGLCHWRSSRRRKTG